MSFILPGVHGVVASTSVAAVGGGGFEIVNFAELGTVYTGASPVTMSSYAVPANGSLNPSGNANKTLLVFAVGRNSASFGTVTATFGGNNLTKIREGNSGAIAVAPFIYLLGSSTPTGDIVISYNTTLPRINLFAMTLFDVVQQAPEADNGAQANPLSSTTSTVSVTTLTNGAIIFDCCSQKQGIGETDPIEDASQTRLSRGNNDPESSPLSWCLSYKVGGTAGAHDMIMTLPDTDQGSHQVVAFEVI